MLAATVYGKMRYLWTFSGGLHSSKIKCRGAVVMHSTAYAKGGMAGSRWSKTGRGTF